MNLKISKNGYGSLKTELLVLILDTEKNVFARDEVPFAAELKKFEKRMKDDSTGAKALITRPAGEGIENLLFLNVKQAKYWSGHEAYRIMAARALQTAIQNGIKSVTFALNGTDGGGVVEAIAEGCLINSYRFLKYKSEPEEKHKVSINLLVSPKEEKYARAAVEHAELVCDSVNMARDLVNEIPAAVVPEVLAQTAKQIAREGSLEVEVLDEKALVQNGYNGVYSVGKASANKPRMMVLRYKPRAKSSVHLALVGKAVTFDTGGYSIKPAKDMWEMKGDMSGGAAVLAVMRAVARLKPNIRITAIVPSAQNMIDGNALLPGDIIRTKNGKTVHVDNTDAEGRLLLMDALTRAKEEGATHVVDAATLTGSCVRALGTSLSGILGNDQEWIQQVMAAGDAVGEQYWQLPLWAEYRDMLNNDFADIDNTGKSPNAGAITAALFLKEFVDSSMKWAHLDIAGTFIVSKNWKYFTPGATGVAARTMIRLVEELGTKAS